MEKEIVDPEGIHKILNVLFGRLPVYILDNKRQYPVKIVSFKPNGLVISHNRKLESEDRFLSLTHNGMLFLTTLKYLGGDNQSYEKLKPIKITIREAERKAERLSQEAGLGQVRVTNTLNQIEIHKAQGFDDANVENILKQFQSKLATKFDYAQIYYSPRLDNRLRLMQNYDKPIFIPNRRESESVPRDYFPFDEYLRLIQVAKIDEKFISEISVPIKYKGYTPLGYIQVMGLNPLHEQSFQAIKMVSQTISKEIIGTGIFQESKEVCEVNDLSLTGLSFLHPQSRFFSRSFAMGEIIIFELHFDQENVAIIRGMIKNMKNMESNFRVGVEFYNLTTKDYQLIENYLGKNS